MTLPKFIITIDGVFRLGQVNQHKHLLKQGDQCIGGGYYHFDFVSNRIILDRESYDFGRPKWHLLEVLKVPSTYRGMRIVYKYDDGFHDDFNDSEELQHRRDKHILLSASLPDRAVGLSFWRVRVSIFSPSYYPLIKGNNMRGRCYDGER